MQILENVSLASHTYYKIGGPAAFFAQPENTDDLFTVADYLRKSGLPYFVLGAGSNVLFDDRGFDGLVLSTSKLDRTLKQVGQEIEVGASVMVIQLLRHCMSNGVAGMEFLVGIPGNMGGVFFMNAGTKLGEVNGAVTQVTAFDLATGKETVFEKNQIQYTYRSQHFLNPYEIVLRGKLQGRASQPKAVQDQVQNLLSARKASQPVDRPSCGSVFKNPTGHQAWRLINDAGLRGHRVGNAQISELHTNFIVNLGGAKADDVKALINEAKERVFKTLSVPLEEEVRIVGYDGVQFLPKA